MNFVRWCRHNSRAVFLLVAVLTLAGLFALFQLPSNIYPELNFPRIVVLVHGDPSAVGWFAERIASELPATEAVIPEPGKEYEF